MFVEIVNPNAKLPTRAHHNDAGCDLYTPVDINIAPGEKVLVDIGIKWAIPDGWVAIIKDKSGIACKKHLRTAAGVIDAGYRGTVAIYLANEGKEAVSFKAGDKVAQVLVVPCWTGDPQQVESLEGETSRGEGGFGSTGAN